MAQTQSGIAKIESSSYYFSHTQIEQSLSNYPNLIILDGHDNPFNGVATSNSILFKHLPEGNEADQKEKISEDFKSIRKSKAIYKSIIYLTEDKKFLDPKNKKAYLNEFLADIIVIDNGYLPGNDRTNTTDYSLTRNYLHLIKKPEVIIPIVQRIFDHVVTLEQDKVKRTKPEGVVLAKLERKIELNFVPDLRNDVKDEILVLWQHKMIIEKYIKSNYRYFHLQFDGLLTKVINAYRDHCGKEKSDNEINDISYFNNIAYAILPADLKEVDDAITCAKAVVFYFFEYCAFGRKEEHDELTFQFKEEK